MNKYEVSKDNAKDYVYVGGKTKHLETLTDEEADILFKNGDKRISEKKSEPEALKPLLNK